MALRAGSSGGAECPNTLYGADTITDQLIAINRTMGVATAVGPFGLTLFGTNTSSLANDGTLITIDTVNGAATVIGKTRYLLHGLAPPAP